MENTYKVDIVSPEKVVFSDENIEEVILPSYEGEMGILKDHISIISFLKPGIVKIIKSAEQTDSFFVEDGIVEFCSNKLTVLSSKIEDTKKLNKEKIGYLISETEKILNEKKLDDDTQYLMNNKIEVLRSLNFS